MAFPFSRKPSPSGLYSSASLTTGREKVNSVSNCDAHVNSQDITETTPSVNMLHIHSTVINAIS